MTALIATKTALQKSLKLRNYTGKALVAVSGGVDSLVLLHWLATHHREQFSLQACYVDHQQRPDVARDWDCIVALCQELKIAKPLKTKLKVKASASEAQLRELRYKALQGVAEETCAKFIFTAHHADDQLETYLLKLMRGSHPSSLRGIAFKKKIASTIRLRPLLDYTKKDLLNYAHQHDIIWSEDSTNHSSRYSRNRVRRELIPLLDDLRPKASEKILRFFKDLEESQTSIDELSSPLLAKASALKTKGIPSRSLDFNELKTILDSLLGSKSQKTTRAHWENIARILKARWLTKTGGGPRKLVQFPGGGQLIFDGPIIRWEVRSETIS